MTGSTHESRSNRSLDYLAATTAQQITQVIGKEVGRRRNAVSAKDTENLITKSLGILQEQGVYAMFLFLLSRSGKETKYGKMKAEERIACQIVSQLIKELDGTPIDMMGLSYPGQMKWSLVNNRKNGKKGDRDNPAILDFITKSELMEKLDTLLLVRDLYEQTLIYARFGAKAAK